MKTSYELVYSFGVAWNNADSSTIKYLLADNFYYTSQIYSFDFKSKDDFLKYFNNKLSLRDYSDITVIAEIGLYNDNYCLILNELIDGKDFKKLLLIETDEGKIISAEVCILFSPESVQKLNVVPVVKKFARVG